MPRRHRYDKPGCLHHVVNRGQDRQCIFTHRADYRFFLALLVCAVRAGRIRVHAYCLMPNHFHLLVESLDGDLSATMQWIQGRYAGYFNASHRHTGHAFGGRFHSFPITSAVYLYRVIRYIARNPWVARGRQDPLQFPWGSAAHHARSASRPIWLARTLVDRYLVDAPTNGPGRQAAYQEAFRIHGKGRSGDDLVERRMAGASRGPDDLDALVKATPAQLARWLKQRADAASGRADRLAMVDLDSVNRAMAEAQAVAAPARIRTGRGRTQDPWPLLRIGLLRDLAGLTLTSAASQDGNSPPKTSRHYALHRAALTANGAYLELVGSIAHRALELAFGPKRKESA